jgi:hypothetical protein
MQPPQQNMISRTGQVCKNLFDLMDDIERIDILYSGSPNWDELITNETIATVPSFVAAGLTAAILSDAIYQIKLVRQQVTTGNLPAMGLLAELG